MSGDGRLEETSSGVGNQHIDHLHGDHELINGAGMDAMVNAATLAAMHPSLKICLAYLLALRHPVPCASSQPSLPLDESSLVSVGGEDRHEMEVCGVDPRTRGRRTNECLEIIRALQRANRWTTRENSLS